ncbi:MAG: helix-turn-helix domain containing protein [Aeromicrobium erythreum]
MGLREMNATRTREHLTTVSLRLFREHGYDGTTMEDVAQAAEVGLSTLYRYFPTKEQLAVAYLGDPDLMARALRARPQDESPEASLGEALVAFVEHAQRDVEQAATFTEVADGQPRVRARLLEWLADAHVQLTAALAERRGVEPHDLHAAASAWLVVLVLQTMSEEQERTGHERPPVEVARDIMARLGRHEILPPRSAP